MKFIKNSLYKEILENIPIPCVDVLIFYKGKILIANRLNEPFKNRWFFPGGRVFKNESLRETAIRKAKEETGLDVEIIKQVGDTKETIYPKPSMKGVKSGAHTINTCFLVKPIKGIKGLKIDKTHKEYRWISKIEEDLHPYIKNLLKETRLIK